jgi:hypothetical protein
MYNAANLQMTMRRPPLETGDPEVLNINRHNEK